MRTCLRCEKVKRLDEFSFKNKKTGKLNSWCKLCFRKVAKTHYEANKQQYLDRNRASKERRKEFVLELKKKPCADCGVSYPYYIMQFDHIEEKAAHISELTGVSWKKLKEELAKCELVCANCHAARTYFRRNEGAVR